MRGPFALQSEVPRRSHQPVAEHDLPQMIHNNASRQRVFCVDDPVREIEPRFRLFGWTIQHVGQHGWLNDIAFRVPDSTNQHMSLPRIFAFRQHHDVTSFQVAAKFIQLPGHTGNAPRRSLINFIADQVLAEQSLAKGRGNVADGTRRAKCFDEFRDRSTTVDSLNGFTSFAAE